MSAGGAGARVTDGAASRTLGELIARAAAELAGVSDTARLEAELLLGKVAGLERVAIMAHPERVLDAAEVERFEAAVARRSRGEPLAYVVGRREFWSLGFAVNPHVLVPRPETELLVELAHGARLAVGARVLDLGTGSGAIALAIKHERPDFDVVAVDRSAAALEVARRNAETLGLEVEWIESDWFAALDGRRFDLIVSNPPYVASDDPHFDGELRFEPRLALDGGVDGLDAYRAVLGGAPAQLAAGGQVMFEHGFNQREALIALAGEFGFALAVAADDLVGQPRVAGFARVGDDGSGDD
jgi:release factor glutamine methyltransferase